MGRVEAKHSCQMVERLMRHVTAVHLLNRDAYLSTSPPERGLPVPAHLPQLRIPPRKAALNSSQVLCGQPDRRWTGSYGHHCKNDEYDHACKHSAASGTTFRLSWLLCSSCGCFMPTLQLISSLGVTAPRELELLTNQVGPHTASLVVDAEQAPQGLREGEINSVIPFYVPAPVRPSAVWAAASVKRTASN